MRVIVTRRTPLRGFIETIECTSRDGRHQVTVTEGAHGFTVTAHENPQAVVVWVCPRCCHEIEDIAYESAKFIACPKCKGVPLSAFTKRIL